MIYEYAICRNTLIFYITSWVQCCGCAAAALPVRFTEHTILRAARRVSSGTYTSTLDTALETLLGVGELSSKRIRNSSLSFHFEWRIGARRLSCWHSTSPRSEIGCWQCVSVGMKERKKKMNWKGRILWPKITLEDFIRYYFYVRLHPIKCSIYGRGL